jgi:S1-C subfamily serine protease
MRSVTSIVLTVVFFSSAGIVTPAAAESWSFADVIAEVQPKMVKIYGAGGFRGLQSYQSGFLISEQGHILTAWSYVLDTDFLAVTLNDGQRHSA